MRVAVIGGGLSGIRAALTLARGGAQVTLFEKNRFLGGRVFSFQTPDLGEIDIGQHVWLKCCTALEELLADLEVPADWIYRQSAFTLPFKRPGGADFELRSAPLPGLLHLLPGLLRFPGLSWTELFRLSTGMARAKLYSATELEALDGITFAAWLARQRQSDAVIAALWEPIILSVCNQRPAEVSARHALFTFRESLLKSKHAADICFLRVPLSQAFDRQARKTLVAAGVELHLGAVPQEKAAGFDRTVLAMPPGAARQWMGAGAAVAPVVPNCAIAGLLLQYSAPVMDEILFAALDSEIQWVFNKNAVWNKPAGGPQLLEIVISGAGRECNEGGEKTQARLIPALHELLPRTRSTLLTATRFVAHAAATFAASPGGETQRQNPAVPFTGDIYQAGDQAATGWPSTMESAVRAGRAAARAILDSQ